MSASASAPASGREAIKEQLHDGQIVLINNKVIVPVEMLVEDEQQEKGVSSSTKQGFLYCGACFLADTSHLPYPYRPHSFHKHVKKCEHVQEFLKTKKKKETKEEDILATYKKPVVINLLGNEVDEDDPINKVSHLVTHVSQ